MYFLLLQLRTLMAYLRVRGEKSNMSAGNCLEEKGLSVKNTGCNDFVAASCGHDTSRCIDIVLASC